MFHTVHFSCSDHFTFIIPICPLTLGSAPDAEETMEIRLFYQIPQWQKFKSLKKIPHSTSFWVVLFSWIYQLIYHFNAIGEITEVLQVNVGNIFMTLIEKLFFLNKTQNHENDIGKFNNVIIFKMSISQKWSFKKANLRLGGKKDTLNIYN